MDIKLCQELGERLRLVPIKWSQLAINEGWEWVIVGREKKTWKHHAVSWWFHFLFGDKIYSRKAATNLWNLIAPALGNNVLFEISWTESLCEWTGWLFSSFICLQRDTAVLSAHKQSKPDILEAQRLSEDQTCWWEQDGLHSPTAGAALWCALREEVGKGREFPLLISEVALHCTAPRGPHGHWAGMPKGGRAWGRSARVGRWALTQTGDSPDAPSSSSNLTRIKQFKIILPGAVVFNFLWCGESQNVPAGLWSVWVTGSTPAFLSCLLRSSGGYRWPAQLTGGSGKCAFFSARVATLASLQSAPMPRNAGARPALLKDQLWEDVPFSWRQFSSCNAQLGFRRTGGFWGWGQQWHCQSLVEFAWSCRAPPKQDALRTAGRHMEVQVRWCFWWIWGDMCHSSVLTGSSSSASPAGSPWARQNGQRSAHVFSA